MNLQKIEQIAVMVDRYPEHILMETWTTGNLVAEKHVAPDCGTTGCIAGWAIALENGAFDKDLHYEKENPVNPKFIAGEILDLTKDQASRLFYLRYNDEDGLGDLRWPMDLSNAYFNARTPREKADVVLARLKVFVDNNGNI